MNRVLSAPLTPIIPGLLTPLKFGRTETVVTERRTVRFEMPLGPVEMSFLAADQQLDPGTRVFVWRKGGGFVCATADELKAEAQDDNLMTRRVEEARAKLEMARQERIARDSAMAEFDVIEQARHFDRPLLQA